MSRRGRIPILGDWVARLSGVVYAWRGRIVDYSPSSFRSAWNVFALSGYIVARP